MKFAARLTSWGSLTKFYSVYRSKPISIGNLPWFKMETDLAWLSLGISDRKSLVIIKLYQFRSEITNDIWSKSCSIGNCVIPCYYDLNADYLSLSDFVCLRCKPPIISVCSDFSSVQVFIHSNRKSVQVLQKWCVYIFIFLSLNANLYTPEEIWTGMRV